MQFCGVADEAASFLVKEHLCNRALWAKFVDVFRTQPDSSNRGWKGEYWGKMMRGAVLVYQYTRDEELYLVLEESVRDMLTVIEEDGRVSSYLRESEFEGWDIWSRKYVILACEYFLEICRDSSLSGELVLFISRIADYILLHIGEGKKDIRRASGAWFGLNSSSILEPMVRLYRLTGKKEYLDFSTYIVENGGALGIDVFSLAYSGRLYPYQYGVSKAYELTSCFEGLLEYYLVTGIEKYRIAVQNYAKAVLESEMSIIGSSGITHELFDHTRTRQTVRYDYDEVMQETCVTVTLMKFFSRMLENTGDSIYADTIEKSFYNAYLGALNTEGCECEQPRKERPGVALKSVKLPFDSYSPLTPGRRGRKVGGYQTLPDLSYYGCCACIGSAGVGVFLRDAVVVNENGVTINFYERGVVSFEYDGVPVTIEIDTDYPRDGKIGLSICAEREVEFDLRLRKPSWVDGRGEYICVRRAWKDGSVELDFNMPICLHYPETWEEDLVYTDMSKLIDSYYTASPLTVRSKEGERDYVAITRGPITLAADSRTGKSADSAFCIVTDGEMCESEITDGVPCLIKMRFYGEDGVPFYLVDYAHAGRDWQSLIAAWLPTK